MMKRPEFLETKRTPRYSLRKLNVGVASVLLGVTIFGINFTDHSVKAATPVESVRIPNDSTTGNLPRTSAVVLKSKVQQSSASNNATANNSTEAATPLQSAPKTQGSVGTGTDRNPAGTVDQNNTNTQKATSAKEKVQQSSASNNATANNSTEAATTLQSAPKTQGNADTDINSLAAKNLLAMNLVKNPGTDIKSLAAKLAVMNLVAIPGTVDPNDTNTQRANENNKLANKSNLTSSDNYSSNIYKDKDGKYYKIVTIYSDDYVYHTADIQANGNGTTAEDTKNNINISKEDLGNGKTRWTVVFFPTKGLQNYGSTLHGLSSAKFGIALTNDYQIDGDVDMDVISDPKQTFLTYIFKPGSNRATKTTVQNPPAEVKFSFNPKTDVEPNGLINSGTMPAYNNKYLQGPYYFTTATDTGKENLWQTYFKKWSVFSNGSNNAYDNSPYLGDDHKLHFNDFKIKNKTGVDGAKEGDPVIYDTRDGVNGVFNSVNFNQAMEFKSQGDTSQPQFSSFVISFTTQHTDSHEVDLVSGSKNQQFSGISANIYSYQDGGWNEFSSLYGEQRALNAKGKPLKAKDIIPNWDAAKAANKAIDTALVNKKGEINTATNIDQATKDNLIKEATDAADVAKNAIAEATTVDAIKKAQEDGVSNINNVKVPTLEDAKKAANQVVENALTNKTNEINNASNLSDQEKHDLVNKATEAAKTAKDNIAKATTNDGATNAGQAGKTAIENFVPTSLEDAKKAANQVVENALTNKTNEINNA
ncbi:LEA family epithelial adhesin, partial [Limosilactobacillus vaginalis]|uniref:LEA family epithelial adhesin n=1 Tax=Limosilactobacillus vaginalis TaxID=1633 RepID=UPI003F26A488